MSRPLLPIALVLLATPALAQQLPAAPLRAPGAMRSFSLTNRSGEVIVSAEAKMTNGKQRVLTYAPIQRNQAREIVVPRQECLDSVAVHLNNGQTLRAAHMNDCKATKIIVGRTGIGVASNENPLNQ
ncbi:MAG TPA: hypothetical protein VMU81_20460 [Acetobacteraceae bacterium]|nr:hypothetical protein [Acetobacteraceae bacterium]